MATKKAAKTKPANRKATKAKTANKKKQAPARELQFDDGKSRKFWRIELDGKSHTVTYGRIGANGQSKTKSFATPQAAAGSHDKLIQQKLDKGYVAIGNARGQAANVAPKKSTPAKRSTKKTKKTTPTKSTKPVTIDDPEGAIICGEAPDNLLVRGKLDFEGAKQVVLPTGLTVWTLRIPNFRKLKELPAGLSCHVLEVPGTPLESLPDDLTVKLRLDLTGCTSLVSLPRGLKVGSLILRGCTSLSALPEGLECCFLDITGCRRLTKWPKKGKIEFGRLLARDCVGLTKLPPWLKHIAQLDISGCEQITSLPRGLNISSWIDVAKSGLKRLPRSQKGIEIRWRGAVVDERIAFHPEKLTADEVLAAQNIELRRAMLDSMGFERFMSEADAQVLDKDRDKGGPRKLLRVKIKNDEDLVCVSVICPSTGRQYLIRVPPRTKTCRQGIAWTAGISDPKKYRPRIET